MQVDRETEVQKDRCTNIHTDKWKKRRTDIHRQTDRQTDSSKVLVQAGKQTGTERPIFTHMVHTNSTVHKTDTQTDRQTGQTENNDKQTNKQTDRQYMSVV